MKQPALKSQAAEVQTAAETTVIGITKSGVKDRPEATRVIFMLDKKASYSTSRENNQLIVNVFNAQMRSSLKELEVQDPLVKEIVTKQVGNSVKGVIELVNAEIAYTPSTSADPYQIMIDIWPLAPQASLKQASESEVVPLPVVPKTVKAIDIDPVPQTQAKNDQELTLNVRESSEVGTLVSPPALSVKGGEVPEQLQWFSEKLSQVLQEKEKLSQELLEIETKFAVKDSMIQVLDRKMKEANARLISLEEEVIKAKSRTSLAEQNEQAIRNELQQLVSQLEGAASGEAATAGNASTAKILSKIAALQKESADLDQTKSEVGSLKAELDAIIQERDELRSQNEAYVAEIATLKAETQRFAQLQGQLQMREQELAKIRSAVGAATAQLVVETRGSAASPSIATQPQQTSTYTVASVEASQQQAPMTTDAVADSMATTEVVTVAQGDDPQLALADLIAKQQMANQNLNPDDYVLGPDDLIRIKVLNEDDLDRTVTVSSDGFITYPYLGDLRVDGLTTGQLDAQVSSLLGRDFLVNPEVVVEVVKPRSKKVYIMGAVKQPGYIELQGDQQLLSTLLNAGGPTAFETQVRILRLPKQDLLGGASQEALAPLVVDLQKLFVEGDQTQNLVLQDGDVLMVTAKSAAGGEQLPAGMMVGPTQFYVVGSVVKPGIYDYKENDTVLDAILRAGGFTEFASRNNVKLVREANGKTDTMQIKMKDIMDKGAMDKNLPVKGGDMIIVPESFF